MTTQTSPRLDHTVETPHWLRPRQWKQLTGMSASETLNQLRRGNLRGVRVGRSWFIPYQEVSDFFHRFERDGETAA
jgi:hypothetical protein